MVCLHLSSSTTLVTATNSNVTITSNAVTKRYMSSTFISGGASYCKIINSSINTTLINSASSGTSCTIRTHSTSLGLEK